MKKLRQRIVLIMMVLLGVGSLNMGVANPQEIAALQGDFHLGMSVQKEIYAGVELDTALRANLKETDNSGLQYYVSRIGEKIGGQSPVYYPFHYVVLDDPRSANAYVVPGGFIYITSGLINLTENEAQLAALLAHETAHIVKRHIVKDLHIQQDLDMDQLMLGHGTPSSPEKLDRLAEYLISHNYFPEEEYEADILAMHLLLKAGYNPIGMTQVLEKLQALEQNGVYISFSQSHPVTPARVELLREYLLQYNLNQTGMILDSQEFHQMVP